MTSFQPPARALPARPSLDSLRKQARRLARDVAAQNAQAIARVQARLPKCELPLSYRDAQLVLAREYGFAGWRDLREEVLKRVGKGLEWASMEAERAVHDNDIDRLKRLLADHPGLLTWRGEDGGTVLGAAVASFGDSGDSFREQAFTRSACAELLIDTGAVVDPELWKNVVSTRASGMLQLLWRKGVLPRTLVIHAALGDLEAVRACFDKSGTLRADKAGPDASAAVSEAFMRACRFNHAAVAAFLLERCIADDRDLGRRIDAGPGRPAFIDYLAEHPEDFGGPWRTFVVNEIMRTIAEDDLPAFVRSLREEPELLGESCIGLQVELIERATLLDRGPLLRQFVGFDPALLRCDSPPPSSALVFALEYGHAHLVPLLTSIWPLPDDLPHAAGMGDLARVRRWFDDAGRPRLGDLSNHYPVNNPRVLMNLHWGAGSAQRVLDVALAWACMNKQMGIAEFLVARGADINTDWSTHEPASILHECAMYRNFEAAQFLIDRGADLTIRDHRWGATAAGWAYNAAKDEEMARFLMQAEEQRKAR